MEIVLVQGNELKSYEIFSSLTALGLATAVGMWTSYFTVSPVSPPLFWSAICFSVLTAMLAGSAYQNRSKIFCKQTKVRVSVKDFLG